MALVGESAGRVALQHVRIADRRQAMHGHDIIQLLSWVARAKGVAREIADAAPLRRAMWGLLEVEDLQKEALFSRIAEWACENS